MVCRRGGLIIQRHNEIRDLEAEMLHMVCTDVETEPVLQEITGEELNRGANKATDARLDVHARGFWDRQQSAFFDVRVCHPKADSIENCLRNRYSNYMKMRRRGNTADGFWKWSKEHSHH